MQFLTRQEYHQKKWKKIFWKDDCPFCDIENDKEVYWRGKYWYLKFNFSPYCWDKRHLMAIPYEHIIYSCDLKSEHFQELLEIQKIVKDFFKDQDYFSFTRESLSNRSVEHLHIHFLVWRLKWKFLRKMLQLQWYPIIEDLEI